MSVLSVVTVVGRGLLRLIAKVGRELGGSAATVPPISLGPSTRCHNCGAPGPPFTLASPGCGLTRASASEAGDLAGAARVVSGFHAHDRLADDTDRQLRNLIDPRNRELHDTVPTV